jgi:flagellar protein FlaI
MESPKPKKVPESKPKPPAPSPDETEEDSDEMLAERFRFLKNVKVRFPFTGTPIPPSWKVIDRYPVNSPFAYAVIAQSPLLSRRYYLDEVPLTKTEAAIYSYLLDALEAELTVPREQVNPRQYFADQARKILLKYSIRVPAASWSKIIYFAERDLVGFGALDGMMRDPNIEDLSIDALAKPLFVYHKGYESLETNLTISDEEQMDNLITRLSHMAGKHVSTAFPIVQGTLPGRHRLVATFRREVSPQGSTATIRKFREDPLTIVDMLNLNLMDYKIAAYTWYLMQNRATAIVVGATGAGKTTLLNALVTLTRLNTKLVTIEEVQEINIPHLNWTSLVSRESYAATEEKAGEVGLFELVKAAMRMRPDILCVGEVRGEEAYVLFQAISTGHGGLCLPPWERLPVRINGTDSLLTMNELFEREWDGRNVTASAHNEISAPKDELLVPSFDIVSNKMRYSKVKRISRRKYHGKLLTLKATGGNSGTVTEDHPMIVLRQGKVVRVPAKELRVGDLLSIVDELPADVPRSAPEEIDLIDEISKAGLQNRVVVRGVKDLLYAATKGELAETLEVRPRTIDDYRKKDYLPFEKYMVLKDTDRRRRSLRYRKSPHMIPAVVPINSSFARLLGFYLAEGHAARERVDFSFNRKETVFAQEVRDALASLFGLRSTLRVSGPEAIQVIVKDRLLSAIFTDVLKAGSDSYTKRVPSLAWSMSRSDVKDLLDAYFQGDGSAFIGKDARPLFQSTTASDDLAYGVYYLMLGIGYHLNVGLDKRYGNLQLTVSGGENFRRFTEDFRAGNKLKGFVIRGNPGQAEKVPIEYVVSRTPHQLLYTKMADGNKFVSRQVVDRLGLARPNGIYFAPVQSIEVKEYSGYVYDLFEVEGSHTFVHGFGVLSSNCTLHADDSASALQRLVSEPMNVPKAFLPFLDLVFVVRRIAVPTPGGGFRAIRRVVALDEVVGAEEVSRSFRWEPRTDTFKPSYDKSPKLERIARDNGINMEDIMKEIDRRALILRWIQQKGIRNFKELSPILELYVSRPEEVFKTASNELEAKGIAVAEILGEHSTGGPAQ